MTLGVQVINNPAEAVKDKDVVMVLRIQLERQSKVLFPGLREYASFFGLTKKILKNAKKDVIVMHPGPMNRGVEITSEVADGPYSVILDQVTNGVAGTHGRALSSYWRVPQVIRGLKTVRSLIL